MVRFINFKVREQDIKRITANLFEWGSPKPFAYYSVVNQMFYWELFGTPQRADIEIEIKSLDDLDKVLTKKGETHGTEEKSGEEKANEKKGIYDEPKWRWDCNFKLDFDIVSTNLTNAELCKKHGINQSRISNRKASLVSRGHLKPSAKAIAKAITQPTNTQEVKTKELVEVLGNVIASFSKEVDKPKVGDFTNNKGVNKEIARNKMAKYIVDSNVEGLVPTLPYIHANIEKKILATRFLFLMIQLQA